jgi:ABC-type Mn2+/Zn2+ transport system permease subunit
VLDLPFLLVIWFSPLAVFSSGLRDRKRRFTIGDALSWLALLAVAFAFVFRAPADGVIIVGMLAFYAIPFAFAILYVPRPWDLVTGVTWSFGALLALLIVFSLAQQM